MDDLAAQQDASPLAIVARPDDLATIVASGGSTGIPKGSCRSFARHGAMVEVPSSPDRRQLVNGELSHLPMVLADQTLLGGGTVVLSGCCEPAATMATVERHAVTHLFLVEPQLADLVDDPAFRRHDLSSLRQVLHIGTSAPSTLRRRFREAFGPIVVHTYGASEIGIVSRLSPSDAVHSPDPFHSAGRAARASPIGSASPSSRRRRDERTPGGSGTGRRCAARSYARHRRASRSRWH